MHLTEMASRMPKVYKQLEKVRQLLEKHYRDMQDMEFTVEEGTLYMLQTRVGKRTPTATFKIAVDMAKEGLILRKRPSGASSLRISTGCFIQLSTRRQRARNCTSANWPLGLTQCRERRLAKPFSAPKRRSTWPSRGKSDFGAARDEPGGCGRDVRRPGNPHGDRRQDQPCCGCRAGLGQVLHRWMRTA